MIRCRCGRYSNYGLTCTSCRIYSSILEEEFIEDEEDEEDEEAIPEEQKSDQEEELDPD